MTSWSDLRQRIAGKWQVPLFVISLVALGASFLNIKPTPSDYPIDQAVEELDVLVSGGLYSAALRLCEPILQIEEKTEAQLAPVYLRKARALTGRGVRDHNGTPQLGREAAELFRIAQDHLTDESPVPHVRLTVTAQDHEWWGQALEWQEAYDEAVRHYERAIDEYDEPVLDLRKHVLSLRVSKLDTPLEESRARLEDFLPSTDDRLDLRLWAIERLVDVLHDQGKSTEAATLLVRHEDQFDASELRDRFAYLRALVLYRTGEPDEAELLLRSIRNRLTALDETDAMTGWLLGRVVLGEDGGGRPLEAISFFENVIATHAPGPYRLASRLGMAEALVSLKRREEAVDAYRIAIDEASRLTGESPVPHVNRNVLRVSLIVNSDVMRRQGRLEAAIAYAELASELIDDRDVEGTISQLQRLSELHESLALQLDGRADEVLKEPTGESPVPQRESPVPQRESPVPQQRRLAARRHFNDAAEALLRLAQVSSADQDRAAEACFHAAELCDRAFNRSRATQLYEAFVADHPESERVSLALLRLGHVRREMGLSAEAADAYRQCRARFPNSLNGARALLPLARTYLAMRPQNLDLAEKTLHLILDDSRVFTPQAHEFADALFLLGDVLNQRGQFERAITVLEETRRRYSKHPKMWRALYKLADSYRQSGMALKNDLKDARYAGEFNQIRAEYQSRLTTAGELYRDLIDHYETADDATLERVDRVFHRHALLYEADCLYENMRYEEALELYETAAGTLANSTAALAAHVQIISCHAFLGQRLEARTALTRAQVLARSLPDESFDRDFSSETREDWQRCLRWLEQSEIF